jgi:tetratricopeptide (TPR) repeat protein
MPKAIKKRATKPQKTESEIRSIVDRVKESTSGRERRILVSSAAVGAVVVLVLGAFLYWSNVRSRATMLRYEGYKAYQGLYDPVELPEEERAQRALEKFRESYELQKTPLALMYVAHSHYSSGQYEEAIKTFQELVQQFPEARDFLPMAYFKMGMAQARAGREEQALETFKRIYASGPAAFGDLALMESARTLERMERKDEAAALYSALLADYPNSLYYEQANRVVAAEETSFTEAPETDSPAGKP